MVFFKYFNRFLVTSLLLAGQWLSVQAYNDGIVQMKIEEIKTGQSWDNSKLDISSCEIKNNEQDVLIKQLTDADSGLSISQRKQINTIDLSGNNFTSFPKKLLALFPNAQVLNLRNNILNKDVNSLLDIPTNITTLNLSANYFTCLPENLFKQLINLQNIDLSYNLQLKIPLQMLWTLSKCKTINIMLTQLHSYLCSIPERLDEQDQMIIELIEWLASFDNLETICINNELPPKLKAMVNGHKYGTLVGEKEYKPVLENSRETILQKQKELNQFTKETEAYKTIINKQLTQISTLMDEINMLGFQ